MKEIAIHEIKDGLVLAADVADERGQVLFAAGRSLDRTHVELLERRGVLTVKIEAADEAQDADGGAPSPEDFAKALARLDHMFEGRLEDPIMRAIYTAARGMISSALPGRV